MAVSGVFAYGEDTHSLRLESELSELRSEYANPVFACARELIASEAVTPTKQKGHSREVSFLFWQEATKKIFLSYLNEVSNSHAKSHNIINVKVRSNQTEVICVNQ